MDDGEADDGGLAIAHQASGVLSLPETLDLKAAAPLAADLLALRGQPLAVDAGEVKRLGGLCLQVLLSAHKTWEADGAAFAIHNPSPAFAEGWVQFGASPRLNGSPLEIGL